MDAWGETLSQNARKREKAKTGQSSFSDPYPSDWCHHVIDLHLHLFVQSSVIIMSSTLGKRKRVGNPAVNVGPSKELEPTSTSNDNAADLQEIFRRAFEAKFKPLPVEEQKTPQEDAVEIEENEEVGDDDWEGLSQDDEEEIPKVQVVEVGAVTAPELSRAQMKAFMV